MYIRHDQAKLWKPQDFEPRHAIPNDYIRSRLGHDKLRLSQGRTGAEPEEAGKQVHGLHLGCERNELQEMPFMLLMTKYGCRQVPSHKPSLTEITEIK